MRQRETSGITTGVFLLYVRDRGGARAVEQVLRRAALRHTEAELGDESHWISYADRIRLFEAAVEVFDDPWCTYEMGTQVLRWRLNPSMLVVLQALGSTQQVYRQVARAIPKFSTTSTMRVLDSGPTHAELRFELHEGYEHSRLDCRYARGLLTTIPQLFNLPPAEVEHAACQGDGAPACLYRVRWSPRPSGRIGRTVRSVLGRRSPDGERPADVVDDLPQLALQSQLEALQAAATDLVASVDLREALDRVTRRAAAAVLAPAHLLAVRDPHTGEPFVRSAGLAPEEAERLSVALLAGNPLGRDAVIVEVASRSRRHGALAALYGPGQRGLPAEVRLLGSYAHHAAAALDLFFALEQSRREADRASRLLALAHQLKDAPDAAAVARSVAANLPQVVGCDTAAVLLWDADAGRLQTSAHSGLDPRKGEVMSAVSLSPAATPELRAMMRTHRPVVLDPSRSSARLQRLMVELGAGGGVAVPLVASGQFLGVATAGWRSPGFSGDPDPGGTRTQEEILTRLTGVAEYAAAALFSAELVAALRHRSRHDALTGLPDRAAFAEDVARAIANRRHDGGSLAVMFCDLDGFKGVNDDRGHAAGDELLCQVASRLGAVVRPGDVVARLGGDEFAILLPGVPSAPDAHHLGQRIVDELSTPFDLPSGRVQISASVGITTHEVLDADTGIDGESLLRTADTAMYQAKRAGRGRVVLAHPFLMDAGVAGPPGPPGRGRGSVRACV